MSIIYYWEKWTSFEEQKVQGILGKTFILALDERAITMTLTSSCHWKMLVPFCLQEKRHANTFLTLTVNYRKIVQRNKLCHSTNSKLAI